MTRLDNDVMFPLDCIAIKIRSNLNCHKTRSGKAGGWGWLAGLECDEFPPDTFGPTRLLSQPHDKCHIFATCTYTCTCTLSGTHVVNMAN